MDSVIVSLDDRLANVGDALDLAAHLDLDTFSLGEREFALPEGADYDVVLTNAGEGILVSGVLRAHVKATCDRCLDDTEFDVAGEVDEYYLFEEPEDAVQDDDDDLEYGLVNADNTIDLSEALLPALLMETPFVVLCREGCKGLCPVCGENLNEHDCGHAALIAERRAASNPFAVLASLDLGGSEDSSS